MKKTVLVFSGPSGAGKSTLIKFLLENFQNIGTTVSCTTRPPRAEEINGVHYHFVSENEFDDLIENKEFLEYVECYGNKYGTLKSSVTDVLKNKDYCILDIDFAGGYEVLSGNLFNNVECIGILILPPSIKALEKRLINRGSETDQTLEIRLNKSFSAEKIGSYDHVIINKDLETAKQNLCNLLQLPLSTSKI